MSKIFLRLEEEDYAKLVEGQELVKPYANGHTKEKGNLHMILADIGFDRMEHHIRKQKRPVVKPISSSWDDDMATLAFTTGRMAGVLSHMDLREKLVKNGVTHDTLSQLDECLNKIAEVFYKEMVDDGV
jgi:hypothetical protein